MFNIRDFVTVSPLVDTTMSADDAKAAVATIDLSQAGSCPKGRVFAAFSNIF